MICRVCRAKLERGIFKIADNGMDMTIDCICHDCKRIEELKEQDLKYNSIRKEVKTQVKTLIFEGTSSITGKWAEDGLRELWVGDDEIIETLEKYEGKKFKVTVEIEE